MKTRHKRLLLIAIGLVVVGLVATLVLNAFRSNLVFFFSPTQVAAGEDVRRRGPRGQRRRRARMELVAVAGQQQAPAGMHVPGERKQAHGGILDPRFAQFHTRGCLTTVGGVKAWSPH